MVHWSKNNLVTELLVIALLLCQFLHLKEMKLKSSLIKDLKIFFTQNVFEVCSAFHKQKKKHQDFIFKFFHSDVKKKRKKKKDISLN